LDRAILSDRRACRVCENANTAFVARSPAICQSGFCYAIDFIEPGANVDHGYIFSLTIWLFIDFLANRM
jgi:hypothetical protein